jgi:shikimate kinase / 3-dehydroquinate synthase
MCPGDSPNLVLTGFMGTGKTAVGSEVAARLGREFLDMDAEIERRAAKSIARIFAEDGEPAFRQLEAGLCQESSARRGLVIATGGGTLLDPANRAAMMRTGTVICLCCDPAAILRRLGAGAGPERPLLAVPDPRSEIERLLAARRPAYAAIPWQIDTSGLSIPEVADRVIELSDTVTLTVRHSQGEYPVHIGDLLLGYAGSALHAVGAADGTRVAVVSNPTVAHLHAGPVLHSLQAAGFHASTCAIPDGEQHKTLDTVRLLYDRLLSAGLDRSGTVLALGGGVTGDIAGFAAATFLRGVRFVQVPTTLLAMADASLGGKTGVDLPQGKNLVGAFKQPDLVITDPSVLATLPAEHLRSGMAEVIKHAVIAAPDLFDELESGPPSSGSPLSPSQLARAIRVKVDIVEQDPFEQDRRAVLNLGHTLGHALESLSGFSLPHGEAVSVGLVAAARIAARLRLANRSLVDRIEAILAAWSLPLRCPPGPFGLDALGRAMAYDKKRRCGALRWVLPRTIGDVQVVDDVPPGVVLSVLHDIGAGSTS